MKTLDPAVEAKVTERSYRVAHILEMQNGGITYRYTDYATDVVYGGHTYTRQPFYVGQIVTDMDGQQVVEIAFDDQDQVILSIALNYDMREWPVTLSEAWLDDNDVVFGRVILVQGTTEAFESTEEGTTAKSVIAVTASRFPEQGRGPRQEYSLSCRFRFKDDQCGHGTGAPGAGATAHTTCNRTLGDCTARLNQRRFGGFPNAPVQGTRIRFGPNMEIFLEPRGLPRLTPRE